MKKNYLNNQNAYIPLVLFPLLFLLSIFKIIDTDLWFHMKAGQIIMETGKFIYTDKFSYTAAGRPWLYHEWLFGVIAYNTHKFFGINGLISGKAFLLTIAFILIYKDMRLRGVNPYLSSFVLFLAVMAARFRFTERPHIFKFFLVVAFIYILDSYRLKNKNRLWVLPFLQIFWTNIHGSFILGPILILLYLVACLFNKKIDQIRILLAIFVFTSLSVAINPYGLSIILFSLGFSGKAVLAGIAEWEPTRVTDFYGAFGFLFAIGVASFIPKYKKLEKINILIFCLFAYMPFKAMRFMAIFSLATAPIIAENLSYLFSNRIYSFKKKILLTIISLLITYGFFVHELKMNRNIAFGLGKDKSFPEKAINFAMRHNIGGNMYNSYSFGGYLIWTAYPERKVFIDGRAEVYDQEFQKSFITFKNSSVFDDWLENINKYNINYAIISSEETFDPIGEWIATHSKWILVYWDSTARVYVNNVPANQDIINTYGHKVLVNPKSVNEKEMDRVVEKGMATMLESELISDIGSNSENVDAGNWLGMLYYKTNRTEDALKVWEKFSEIEPSATIYLNIGSGYLEKNMPVKAIDYFRKAVEIDKRFGSAYFNMGKAYESTGNLKEAAKAYRKFIKHAGVKYNAEVKELEKNLKENGL